MACWGCLVCFVFVGLTLKSLLSHINTTHSRPPDFHLICGVDGCTEEYRVFNSFYYHLKRTHSHYFSSGNPPRGWLTSRTGTALGHENFGVALFAECTTDTRQMEIYPIEAQDDTPPGPAAVLNQERDQQDLQDVPSLGPADDLTSNQVRYVLHYAIEM